MMGIFQEILFAISNAFLVPVILLLLLFFAVTVVYLGGFISEAIVRQRGYGNFKRCVNKLRRAEEKEILIDDIPARFGFPRMAFQELKKSVYNPEKLLDDLQLDAERILERLNLGVRLGPMLGLAGTLIPLGPALVALSAGDIATLSSNLVVAFTITVLGIIVGGLCFAIYSVRRHWYTQDINDIGFIVKKICKQ